MPLLEREVMKLHDEFAWPPRRRHPYINFLTYLFALCLLGPMQSPCCAQTTSITAEELELRLRSDPNDLEARTRLITYYSLPLRDEDEAPLKKAGRSRHILWLIEHLPGTSLLGEHRLCTFNREAGLLHDIDAYEKGKQLWTEQLRKFPGHLIVMEHAVNYLEINDPEEAERIILEMIQKDHKYESRLGELYALAILGVTAVDYRTGKPTQSDAQAAHSAFALRAFETVKVSSTPALLAAVREIVTASDPHIWVGGGPPPDLEAVMGAAPPQRIRVGGNVMQAKLIRQPRPIYPPEAIQARISGVVRLNVIIGKDGTIINLSLASGHPLLVPAAEKAVKQWVYEPTRLKGMPVEVVTQIDVNFTLSQ
jgi:TonB family protein